MGAIGGARWQTTPHVTQYAEVVRLTFQLIPATPLAPLYGPTT